jgi:hypothetical protein
MAMNTGVHVYVCLFQSDVAIPLKPDCKSLETKNEIFEAVSHYCLQELVLQKLRKYLTVVRLLEYSLPQHMEKVCILQYCGSY